MYNTLVFEGGGIKGLCYVGALEKLKELELLKDVRFVGGTSAGSLVAALLASDHTTEEMKSVLYKMDWNRLKDGNGLINFFRLFKRFGFHKGDALEQFVEDLLFKKLRRKRLTFLQMYLMTGKHLKMVGTNLTQGRAFYMDYKHTPDMTVAKGVRISCCLPLMFEPVVLNGDNCIDGGVLNNLDVHMFDGIQEVDRVLAFDLQEEPKQEHAAVNLAEYVIRIVRKLHTELNTVKDPPPHVTVLPIRESQIEFTNFDLNDLQKRYMLSIGREAVEKFPW
jgi:predicted acylesterase/phospholipase RssA